VSGISPSSKHHTLLIFGFDSFFRMISHVEAKDEPFSADNHRNDWTSAPPGGPHCCIIA
jgi:hypothetical protein